MAVMTDPPMRSNKSPRFFTNSSRGYPDCGIVLRRPPQGRGGPAYTSCSDQYLPPQPGIVQSRYGYRYHFSPTGNPYRCASAVSRRARHHTDHSSASNDGGHHETLHDIALQTTQGRRAEHCRQTYRLMCSPVPLAVGASSIRSACLHAGRNLYLTARADAAAAVDYRDRSYEFPEIRSELIGRPRLYRSACSLLC